MASGFKHEDQRPTPCASARSSPVTTRKNTSETKAGGASLGVKSNTANTSTGSADNAGDMTP